MTEDRIMRVEAKTLKAQCIEELEGLIISGELAVGELLPPERELALRLGASRPVVHEAIVDLASRGFVRIEPRRGVRVNDYWREGTLAIFESIILHNKGVFPPDVFAEVAGFRRLIEVEAASLAARRKGGDCLARLEALVAREAALPSAGLSLPAQARRRAPLDAEFHLLLSEASGNRILLLVMHSIKPACDKLIERFYEAGPEAARVIAFHRGLVEAIGAGSEAEARSITEAMLAEGASVLSGSLDLHPGG
jgi:DNA-binding FadR family transcriptional regulator